MFAAVAPAASPYGWLTPDEADESDDDETVSSEPEEACDVRVNPPPIGAKPVEKEKAVEKEKPKKKRKRRLSENELVAPERKDMRSVLPDAPERKEMRGVFPAGMKARLSDEGEAEGDEEKTEASDDDRPVGNAVRLAPAPLYTVRTNIRSIAVYSCGWDALGVQFQPTLSDMVESLNSAIRQRFKAMPSVDTFVETKMFKDRPDGTRHCGEHINALSKVVDHAAFPGFLNDVKGMLHDISEDTPSGHIALVTVCKGGNCRGVSVARILSHIFDKAGYLCGAPNHLHKLAWEKTCLLHVL